MLGLVGNLIRMFTNLFASPKIIRIDDDNAIHICPICRIEEVQTKVFNGLKDLNEDNTERVNFPEICDNCKSDNPSGIWCAICRRFKFSDSPCECY